MIIFDIELNPFHSYKIRCESEYIKVIAKYLLDKEIKIDENLDLVEYGKLLDENKFIYIVIDYFTNERDGYFRMNFIDTFGDCFDIDIHKTIGTDSMKLNLLVEKIKKI